jgi:hypothetical protein
VISFKFQFFWKMRLSENEVGNHYFEFIVAFLQRSYKIKKEEEDTIDDQLVIKILNSVSEKFH